MQKNEGHKDTNGDVGGAGGIAVTGESGNGYDQKLIGDGKFTSGPNSGKPVLYSRLDPTDSTIVEFAIDYLLLAISPLNLSYLEFEAIKGGPKDPQNYLWNDEYTAAQAGTPYTTAGLGNIYELDTLRGGSLVVIPPPPPGGGVDHHLPEPASIGIWALLAAAAAFGRRRRRVVRH